MVLPIYLVVFILGLLFGSFLNVVIYRLPREESIVTPGSHCPQCNTPLKAGELIPVVSYLIQKGRCKTCGAQISSRYPKVELLTALLLTLQFHYFGFVFEFVFFAFLTLILVALTMIDYDLQIIPDELNLLLLVLGVVYLLVVRLPEVSLLGLLPHLIGFVVGGGLFLLIAVVSKGGMGGGDIKLMAALGLWFGWQQLLVLMFISFVSGAAVSLLLMGIKLKGRKDAIPFGPFIAFAAYVTSVFGTHILNWYFHLQL